MAPQKVSKRILQIKKQRENVVIGDYCSFY